MTEFSVLKSVPAALAAAVLLGLGGCDRAGGVISQTLAQIKTVPVDANDRSAGTNADRKINAKDVALLVDTAKALTVGKDGVLSKSARTQAASSEASDSLFSSVQAVDGLSSDAQSGETAGEKKLQIAVVDPLRMDRPDDGPPLDVGLHGVEMDPQAALAAARRALPDIPVAVQTAVAQFTAPKSVPAPSKSVAATDDQPKTEMVKSDIHRSIQIGSFGTMAAAQNALEQLRDSHPVVVEHYRASFQKVVTGAGRALVRVKLGPVDSDAQAQKLCGQLDIHDLWCHKAG